MEETSSLARSRRMGEMPEGKLLLSMAVPMMLSMLVQALYNIVDSVYVARVSEDCLSALSLAFPAQNILIGLGTGTGVGVSTMLSRSLGSRDNKLANRVAGNSLFLCVCCWIIMAVFGIFFADAFIHSQTDIESIRSYGESYLRIVTIGSVFVYFEINFERLLQSTGQTKLSMWAQIIGAVANIILDPFFIYGWCGLPAMGTTGAAIATVIGQAFGALAGFLFHHKHNKEVNIRLSDCRPDGHIILDIYRIGFPSILMVGIGSLTNYLMNRILMAFTSTAVAVYGAYFKLQSFFFMPVFGLNNGIVPIVGYNYGAGNFKRVKSTYLRTIVTGLIVGVIGWAIFQFCTQPIIDLFGQESKEYNDFALKCFHIFLSVIFLVGFLIPSGIFFQSIGKPMKSMIATLSRQLIYFLPSAFILGALMGVEGLLYAGPVGDILAAITVSVLIIGEMRLLNKEIAKQDTAVEQKPA